MSIVAHSYRPQIVGYAFDSSKNQRNHQLISVQNTDDGGCVLRYTVCVHDMNERAFDCLSPEFVAMLQHSNFPRQLPMQKFHSEFALFNSKLVTHDKGFTPNAFQDAVTCEMTFDTDNQFVDDGFDIYASIAMMKDCYHYGDVKNALSRRTRLSFGRYDTALWTAKKANDVVRQHRQNTRDATQPKILDFNIVTDTITKLATQKALSRMCLEGQDCILRPQTPDKYYLRQLQATSASEKPVVLMASTLHKAKDVYSAAEIERDFVVPITSADPRAYINARIIAAGYNEFGAERLQAVAGYHTALYLERLAP